MLRSVLQYPTAVHLPILRVCTQLRTRGVTVEPHIRTLLRLVSLAAIVILVAACSQEPTTASAPDSEVFFPRQLGGTSTDAALLKGKLVLDDQGCIRVNSDAGYLLLWPEDFSVRGTGSSVQILDGQERVVARIGDQVEMSGGAVDTHEWPHSKAVQDLPAECKGPYWMVGKFG